MVMVKVHLLVRILGMSEELKAFGEQLRMKREESQLTLREVENSTSIRVSFLQAIEEGTINNFLAGVYAIGFIKQYGDFLKFDMEKMMKEYPKAFRKQGLEHDFNYGIGTLEMRLSLSGGMKWIPNVLWAVGIATAAVIVYYAFKVLGFL